MPFNRNDPLRPSKGYEAGEGASKTVYNHLGTKRITAKAIQEDDDTSEMLDKAVDACLIAQMVRTKERVEDNRKRMQNIVHTSKMRVLERNIANKRRDENSSAIVDLSELREDGFSPLDPLGPRQTSVGLGAQAHRRRSLDGIRENLSQGIANNNGSGGLSVQFNKSAMERKQAMDFINGDKTGKPSLRLLLTIDTRII